MRACGPTPEPSGYAGRVRPLLFIVLLHLACASPQRPLPPPNTTPRPLALSAKVLGLTGITAAELEGLARTRLAAYGHPLAADATLVVELTLGPPQWIGQEPCHVLTARLTPPSPPSEWSEKICGYETADAGTQGGPAELEITPARYEFVLDRVLWRLSASAREPRAK